MKNKFAILGLMLIVFFGGVLGLVGCGDKYQNLKIELTGQIISVDEDGQQYIEVEYDETAGAENIISFSAVLSGFTDDMKTSMTLSVPQDKAQLDFTRIRGSTTLFTVKLLSSGVMNFVVYSDETSKVFASIEVRALLRTQAIADKQSNLTLMRPSNDTAEYILDDEMLINFTPYYSTARDLVYSVGNVTGISITKTDGVSKIKVSANAVLGIVPITVRSSRIVVGSDDYDGDLTDEQKEELTTTIYAFVYDYSWQLGAYSTAGEELNKISLSSISSQYTMRAGFSSYSTTQTQDMILSTIPNVYPVYSAVSNNEQIVTIDAQDNGEFLIYSGEVGSTTITISLDLYYVPGLNENTIVGYLSQYRKVMTYQKIVNVSVVNTPTKIQFTTSNGIVSDANVTMGIFEQETTTDDEGNAVYTYGSDAYVDVNILPLRELPYDYRKISLTISATYNDEDYTERAKAILKVYYYAQNILQIVDVSDDETDIITCGENGIRLFVAFDKETADSFDKIDIKVSTLNITDVYDVVSNTITCNIKEGVKDITDIMLASSLNNSIIHRIEGTTENDFTRYAYISLDDKTNGVECAVKYITNDSQGGGITDGNQVFNVSVPPFQDVATVAVIENSNRFVIYPNKQGTVLVTVTSENNKTFEFIIRVIKGVSAFSIDYELLSGTAGDVTYNTGGDESVQDYGLNEIYLKTESKIILKNIINPASADIIIANQPYSITAMGDGITSGGVYIASNENMGQRVLTLTTLKAGEYKIKCTASAFVADEYGVWSIQPVNREFTLYVFNPVNGVIWNINGEDYYGTDDQLVYEIYDNDAVAFDKQNTFAVSGLNDYAVGSYYLNPMGFDAFSKMGYPGLNPLQLTDRKLYINFKARPYCNDRVHPNYINSEDGTTNEIVQNGSNPSLHYSIDYASTSLEDKLASIINIGTNVIEYSANNSTQAYSPYSIWMGFTSVLNNDAKQYEYEYKISVIIKQANTLTTTSMFTLRIIQPIKTTELETQDEIELEYGGLNTAAVAVNLTTGPNNAYDNRWIYSLDGAPFTFDMLSEVSSGGRVTQVLDNGIVCFDPNTMQLSLSDSYAGGSTTTSLTFWAVDSIPVLRNMSGDKYYALYVDSNRLFATASPANGALVGLSVLDDANNTINSIYASPAYKTIIIRVNAGDTPDNAFLIESADDFENFVNNIRLGKSYAGQYIRVTKSISNIDLSALDATDNTFGGTLFAYEPVTLHFVDAPYNLLGKMVNASIQNITFEFENSFEINTTDDYAGIIAQSIVYNNVNASSTEDTINLAYTSITGLDATMDLYKYIINNVHVVLRDDVNVSNIEYFGVLAGFVQGGYIQNSSITFANFGDTIKGVNTTGIAALGGMIGRTTNNSYINDQSTIIYQPTVLNHCVVRLYNNNALTADLGFVGGMVGMGDSIEITNSYVFAYNKSYPTINGQSGATVGGLVGTMSNSNGLICKIQNSFASAYLKGATLGVLYATGPNNLNLNYVFANIISSQNDLTILDDNATIVQAYLYLGVFDGLSSLTYTTIQSSDLNFDNLDDDYWTTAYPQYNDEQPLLLYNNELLYENILPAINCSINTSYAISAYNLSSELVEGSTKVLVRQGQTYTLSTLLDGLDNLASYDVVLMPKQSYAGLNIQQTTYKNVGEATLSFTLPGVYSLMLVSLQNTQNNQTFDFLVSADVSMINLFTESLGEDKQLIGGVEVNAHTGDNYRIGVLNVPYGLDDIAYIRYYVSSADKTFISFNNQEWTLDTSTNKYFVDVKMNDNITMKLNGNVSVEYAYLLKYAYANDVYYSPISYAIAEGENRFAFDIKIVPDAYLDVSSIDLYTSDDLQVVLTSNVNSMPTFEGGSYLDIVQNANVVQNNGKYEFTHTISVNSNYKYLTETVSQTIVFKQNNIVVASLTINILPTPIASVFATYYFGGADKIDDNSTQSSHTIIPGGRGVFKLNVDYSFSNYEFIEVYSSELQNTTIFFTQYCKQLLPDNKFEYIEIPNGSVYQDGKLILRKITGISLTNEEYFDGTYYVATYVPKSITESATDCYYVNFDAKLLEGDGYVNAFSQDVVYALYPGFVSTVNIIDVKTAVADNATYLATQGQKIPFKLSTNLRNTTVTIETNTLQPSGNNALDIYNSDGTLISTNYVTNATQSKTDDLYAIVNAPNGEDAVITITVTQDGQVVDIQKYTFVVVDKVVPKALDENDLSDGYHITYNEKTHTYSDALSVYTNIYTTLTMYHDEYAYDDTTETNKAKLGKSWNEITEISDEFIAWTYNNRPLATGDYEYFRVEEISLSGHKYYRVIGLVPTTQALTMKVQAYIYYTKDLTTGEYTYGLTTNISNKTYAILQTINYEFALNVEVGSTEEAPLHIASVEDFKKLKTATEGYYILTTDIVLDNWVPFTLNVTNLDFNNHRVVLRSFDLSEQKNAAADSITAGLFTTIGQDTLVRNLILDISPLIFVDAMDKSNVDFGFVAGINNGIIYNVDVVAFDEIVLPITITENNGTKTEATISVDWAKVFDYKHLNLETNSLELTSNQALNDDAFESTLDTFNYDNNRIVSSYTKSIYDGLADDLALYPASVFILTGGYNSTISSLNTHIGGIVGTNNGYITNARVGRSGDIELNTGENISNGIDGDNHPNKASSFNIFAGGYVAGVAGVNENVISSSYYQGGYIINTATSSASNTKTAGLVAMQTNGSKIYSCYASGGYEDTTQENENTSTTKGGIKAQGTVAGLVHTNGGLVDNSLSNISLFSSAGVGGMVYQNNGTISTSLSLSRIQSVNSIVAGLFVGVNSQQTLQNYGKVDGCYYLAQDNIVKHTDEPAYALSNNTLTASNLYGFSVFEDEEETDANKKENYIWQIYEQNEDKVVVNLVAANTITYGSRITQQTQDALAYISNYEWGSAKNPVVLASASDWNKYFGDYEDSKLTETQKLQILNYYENGYYYRLISDIDFAANEGTNFPQSSYKYRLAAHLQGNGLTINNINFITDSNTSAASKEMLGLFKIINNSSISSLNINLGDGIIAGDYDVVGVLAGKISNSNISNINISGAEGSQIVGYQVVGGLAGLVENSQLNGVSARVSVSASYIATGSEVFGFGNLSLTSEGKKISYAGAVAGILTSTSDDKKYVAKYLTVDANTISISAEHAGSIVGLVDQNVELSYAKFVLAPAQNYVQRITSTGFVAGGLVGENRGSITCSSVDYDKDTQTTLDTQSLTSTDVNTTLGNLDIFANTNSLAIGGLVGLNYGGSITDSYTRIETTSKKAVIAGGLIGIATSSEISKFDTSNIDSLFGSQINANTGGNAISGLDRVYTTSFVYAKNCVGGLVGCLIGQVLTNQETTIVALNKMPQNSTYNYSSVNYKGNTIGMYLSTNQKDIFIVAEQNQPATQYSSKKYGIFAVNQGGTYNQVVFDNEIGNLQPYNQLYSTFVQGYDVSYLETLQEETIIFSGMSARSGVWSVDADKTSRIMPVLVTSNTVPGTTIQNFEEWNQNLQYAYGAKSTYTLINDINQTDTAPQAFDAENITLNGVLVENNVTTVRIIVDNDYKPIFGNAKNLTLNNINFEFYVQTTNAISLQSLLCTSAENCAFNNVNITIANATYEWTDEENQQQQIEVQSTELVINLNEVFGGLVAKTLGEIKVYNCQVNGNIKLAGTTTASAYVGGLIGDIAYDVTNKGLSSVYSGDYGSLKYNFANLTIAQESAIGGLVGRVSGAHTVHSTSASEANLGLTLAGSLTANANVYIGGLVGYLQNAIINNISVKVSGSISLGGSGSVNFGSAVGAMLGTAKAQNITIYKSTTQTLIILAQVQSNVGGLVGLFNPSNTAVLGYGIVRSNIIITNTQECNIGGAIGKIVSALSTAANIVDSVLTIGDITICDDTTNSLSSTGTVNVGGVAGLFDTASVQTIITNCATYGKIVMQSAGDVVRTLGGFVGRINSINYQVNNSVAYGIIDVAYTGTTNILYMAGAIGYVADNNISDIIKTCVIGTGLIYDYNEKVVVDAIINIVITNANYAAALTKVYYAPNMIGQFTKCVNTTTLTINDLTDKSDESWWAEENKARTNPTNFAIKTAEQDNILYLVAPSTLINNIPEDACTRLLICTDVDLLENGLAISVIDNANILLKNTQNVAKMTPTDTISINNIKANRVVADDVYVQVVNPLFSAVPRIIISGIRLSLSNNLLNVTINSETPFGLLANQNFGVVFDCSLGDIIDESITELNNYHFNGEDNLSVPNYYVAPNYTTVIFDVQNTNAFIGGLIGRNECEINGCCVYADFVFDTNNTSHFGGITGLNVVLQNSYIIGRQLYRTTTQNNLGKALIGSGLSASNCAAYVIQYYNNNDDAKYYKTATTPSTQNQSIWVQDDAYNYGVCMFARYYNDQTKNSKYYTGDGMAMPLEIIDYEQLYNYCNNGNDYDYVLVKNLLVTSAFNTQPNLTTNLNGNGHTIFVRSYPKVTDTTNKIDKYSVFGTITNTASIYDLNVCIMVGMELSTTQSDYAINFGGLALTCRSSNVQNILVYTNTQIEGSSSTQLLISGYTKDSYIGGLFAVANMSELKRIYTRVNIVINETTCTLSKMYLGALIGRADRSNTITTLSISMCKIDTCVGYMIGKLQTPGSLSSQVLTVLIQDCYTTKQIFTGVTTGEQNGSQVYKVGTDIVGANIFKFVQDKGDGDTYNQNTISVYSSYYYMLKDDNTTLYGVFGEELNNGGESFEVLTDIDEVSAKVDNGNWTIVNGVLPKLKYNAD